MELIMPKLAIKRGKFLEVQVEYRAGIPCVWNPIFVMAAGEMLVREWIPTQHRAVFSRKRKVVLGSWVECRAENWLEWAVPGLVLFQIVQERISELQIAVGSFPWCITDIFVPHTSSQLRAQLSWALSAHISSPRLMTPVPSHDTATCLH